MSLLWVIPPRLQSTDLPPKVYINLEDYADYIRTQSTSSFEDVHIPLQHSSESQDAAILFLNVDPASNLAGSRTLEPPVLDVIQ